MRAEKAAGALGAVVDVDLADVARSNDAVRELETLLFQHEVLFFRDQTLAAPVYAELGARLGDVETHPAYPTVAAAPTVQILESTAENPSKIEVWHSDMTFRPRPPSITLLYGQILPAYGGDTLWASATAAYRTLSAPFREMLDEAVAVNDFRHGFQESLAEPGGAERLADAIAENPPVEHPVVRTHPVTGARALYVNGLFTTRLKGFSRRESSALLEFLYRHITTEEHTVRLGWRAGTIAMWDNRLTQHKPVNDYFPQHRKMYRLTIVGEVPS